MKAAPPLTSGAKRTLIGCAASNGKNSNQDGMGSGESAVRAGGWDHAEWPHDGVIMASKRGGEVSSKPNVELRSRREIAKLDTFHGAIIGHGSHSPERTLYAIVHVRINVDAGLMWFWGWGYDIVRALILSPRPRPQTPPRCRFTARSTSGVNGGLPLVDILYRSLISGTGTIGLRTNFEAMLKAMAVTQVTRLLTRSIPLPNIARPIAGLRVESRSARLSLTSQNRRPTTARWDVRGSLVMV
ncbi:hypothetical protein B0T10DRAFT_550758 [Thelonectria olida]|uniref:Uncharacterized protein n=1 Tax=Thelonectria olida TaxID=1576542 RepID=A0A9P8VZJ2_9HYPO|nr:hypothetical protein B0T10DRAFT_550758 [Thelonectria olida]